MLFLKYISSSTVQKQYSIQKRHSNECMTLKCSEGAYTSAHQALWERERTTPRVSQVHSPPY